MTLVEVAATYKAALPEGTFFHFPVTAIDRAGVPSWSNIYLPGPLGGGDGYGVADIEAEVGALGELHERLQSKWGVPTLETEEGSFDDMVATYGEKSVINPVTLGLPAGSDYTPEMPRLWTKMQRYPEGERWALLEAAASSPSELPESYTPLFLPVSNGLGAGIDLDRALCHGVLEILQRDGNSVSYRALDQGRVVDVSSGVDEEVEGILGSLKNAGLTVNVKLAATDFGLVNLYVNGYGQDDDHPQIKLAAGGEACDLDRAAALRKALLEFAFARARLAFSHGPLDEVKKYAPEGYLEAHRSHFRPENEEQRALEKMLEWLELSPAELKTKLAPIYAERECIAWTDLPSSPKLAIASPKKRLEEVAKRLEDFEISYLELATPKAQEHGVRAVKVVIPGLEVETVSYGRIGERNFRRLLERDSNLVSLGEPSEGAARVHLTDQVKESLGSPAWFHLEKLAETVGDLYPLYREPSRHAVRYVLEQRS